jgi:hypothetical protein
MDNYLIQLVNDMRKAAKNVPDPQTLIDEADLDLPKEFEMFADVELYLHGPLQKISEITGIDTAALPSGKKLTGSQMSFLYDEMKRLLNAYCFYPDFPEGLSVEIKYRLLRKEWENKHVLTATGHTGIEFCSYLPEECPFPEEFCSCKDFLEEE